MNEEFSSKLQYFPNVDFVQKQFIPRKTTENLKHIESEESRNEMETDTFEMASKETKIQTSMDSFLKNHTSNWNDEQHSKLLLTKTKTNKEFVLEKEVQIENNLFNDLKNNSYKDDDYFALSIMPYLRRLPTYRKLVVRSKFQEILAKEYEKLYQIENVSHISQITKPKSRSQKFMSVTAPQTEKYFKKSSRANEMFNKYMLVTTPYTLLDNLSQTRRKTFLSKIY